MTPQALARELEEFLAEARQAVVVEDGAVAFDLARARYSVSGARGKCLLHLWSEERNTVRRVLDAELKNGVLRLSVQRFGQARPSRLEICRDPDRRTPSARRAQRAAYTQLLRAVLERQFPGWTLERLTASQDLERSFGPIYARGLLRRGQSAFAVFGVNAQETQAAVDAALTFALLWLDHCRAQQAGRAHVEGLRLFLPAGRSAVVRERMAHLDRGAAKWQLCELEERDRVVTEMDTADRGNIITRLVQCPDPQAARARFADAVERVLALAPEAEVAVLSAAEIAFRLHGLEFARARLAAQPGSFRNAPELVFGLGAAETPCSDHDAAGFQELITRIAAARRPGPPPRDAESLRLWRLRPERWLESLVLRDLAALDPHLDPDCAYSQVPAFSASDRAMIDVLGITRAGRLAVIELKADEDIHLPLQGLDYWARVAWHHARHEFTRYGYFPGRQLAPQPPSLLLVAPALRVHPATDALLRYFSPGIDWSLAGIDENWREGVKVVFRKHPQTGIGTVAR